MQIEERALNANAITILDIKDNLTFAENAGELNDAIDRLLLVGRKQIVLNLAEVSYIDSKGLQVITKAYMAVLRQGGRLLLSDPTQRINDLLRLTKLVEIFDVVQAEEIVGVFSADHLAASCPICVPANWIALRAVSEYQSCARCGLELQLPSWPLVAKGGEATVECAMFRSPTYDGEYVNLEIAEVQRIVFDKRVDVFASEVAERLWRLLPPPRRVVFGVGHQNFTDDGLQTLLNLCAISTDDSRSVVAITGVDDKSRPDLPKHPAVHDGFEQARQAVNSPESQLSRIRLHVRRSETGSFESRIVPVVGRAD